MDQLEEYQVVIRDHMITTRAQIGQLMETIQAITRGQDEIRQAILRPAATNPLV